MGGDRECVRVGETKGERGGERRFIREGASAYRAVDVAFIAGLGGEAKAACFSVSHPHSLTYAHIPLSKTTVSDSRSILPQQDVADKVEPTSLRCSLYQLNTRKLLNVSLAPFRRTNVCARACAYVYLTSCGCPQGDADGAESCVV